MRNILKFNIFSWKYLKNWIPNCVQFFKNFKWAYQRVINGWCEPDVWCMSDYLVSIIPEMLQYLVDELEDPDSICGYPGVGDADTPEKWVNILKDMQEQFKLCDEDYIDKKYPKASQLYEEYLDHIVNCHEVEKLHDTFGKVYSLIYEYDNPAEAEKVRAQWAEEIIKNGNRMNKAKNKALDLFKKWFWSLGD